MKNRAGSYKKKLLDINTLAPNKSYILKALTQMEKLKENNTLYTTLYLLLFLRLKHPKNWLQRKSKISGICHLLPFINFIPSEFHLSAWEKEKLKDVTLEDLFLNFHLKSFPASINRTMLAWIYNEWSIALFFHVPKPQELLAIQAAGQRCITLITTEKKIDTFILNNRDPLSFALHDIMHADQFFNTKETIKGQIGFYKYCLPLYDHSSVKEKILINKDFKQDFEYSTSDMNAYVIHLFKCLKHALCLDDESGKLFLEIINLWKMTPEEKLAAINLNSINFNLTDEIILKNFFENGSQYGFCNI